MTDKITIRLAVKSDADYLLRLNTEFNGEGLSSEEDIAKSLEENKNEIVAVAACMPENRPLAFCCAQLKRSMCYREISAEICELYVEEAFRRQRIASSLLKFTEDICRNKYNVNEFTLLTGKRNTSAQALYKSCGFTEDEEIHFTK